ncbi:hypothetical protein CLAFUW4_00670 [Fulvia fulva]|uniref:Uncharacterized protein n=1 Tax=Passalora fulva TaxID=5499 RepID=A0A9Q8P2Q2_PASFU|nr:uncharacterized protein CLAFUR5_00673 [Fulvia fulva]KAK4634387.1 hypothetical protein CLAFUR4_00671 [Fulvia fulva]KAK4637886.1 hypothetical protein CLAFUR0_00672 [Fulvia fulva]UJO10936.1 hypothetical protein CLAFUR5_00673 [Fulvia fulva]WPV09912.1 hypothetical protein CLAFUW4_00670 [Fulvia fulva]WPV24276.1 hypothetical protein CLAFUW7_00675 [Fulvia fulva]
MVSNSAVATEARNAPAPQGELDDRAIGDAGGQLHSRQRLEVVPSDEHVHQMTGEGDPSPTSTETRDGLRRTGSKIANLRAAFEKQIDDDSGYVPPTGTIGQLERMSTRSKEQEAEVANLKERHDMELTKLIEDHELEIARLKEEHEANMIKEEELRQAYEEKCTGLEDEIEAFQDKLAKQDAEWQLEIERQCDHLHREKDQAQEGARNLQRQLSELKKGISAATRIEHQTSDSTLAQEFSKFFHETQNWIVNNFRKMKKTEAGAGAMCARLSRIADGRHVDYLKPIFERFDTSIRLAAFQATVACYMMKVFDDPLLFGIPTQPKWSQGIRMAMEAMPEVLSPIAFNRWRAMTVDALRQCKGDEMKQAVESASHSMSKNICNALNTLTEAEESEARIASLGAILKRAISLAHLFRVQRPRYDFTLPPPGAMFDPLVMEDVSVEDDCSALNGIRCAVWPCVIKHGDQDGNKMDMSNIVVKSRVLCG